MTRLKGHDKVEGARQGGRGMTRLKGHDRMGRGCLAIAWHDGVGGTFFEQPTVPIVRLNFSAKITGDENFSLRLLWGKKPWG